MALICSLAILFAGGSAAYGSLSQNGKACLPFESFDHTGNFCFGSCNSGPSCAELDKKYAAADLSRPSNKKRDYFEFYTDPLPPASEANNFLPSQDTVFNSYLIRENKLGKMVSGTSTPSVRRFSERTWQLIAPIIPKMIAAKLSTFSEYTDLTGDSGAMASSNDEAGTSWDISFNDAHFYTDRQTLSDRGETIHTVVHELGHVITLGYSVNGADPCHNFASGDQCIAKGSYVDKFAKEFWPQVYKKGGDVPAAYEQQKFVSSYAATNIAEDMAESWTAFVLLDKPNGNSIADQKVLFFYRYPEFLKAREYMLAHLGHIH